MRFRISNTRLVEDPLSFRLLTKRSNQATASPRTGAHVIRLAGISQRISTAVFHNGSTIILGQRTDEQPTPASPCSGGLQPGSHPMATPC